MKIKPAKRLDNFMVKGDIDRVIFTIAAPLMINNLIRTLYTLTDGLFVARLSELDFAATSFVWPLNYVFISLGLGLGVGATSLIAQLLGADRESRAEDYVTNGIIMSIVLGFVLSAIGFFASDFMVRLMGAEGELLTKSVAYLRISFIGLFFDFVFFSFQAILASQGMTRSITFISLVSSVTNIVLDPLFIFDRTPIFGLRGLGWGIEGAAWATVMSKLVLFVLALYILARDSRLKVSLSPKRSDFSIMKHIMKISLPSALGNGGSALGFTMLNSLITSYGTTTLAAYSMVNRITDLFTQPANGIGGALTSIIGQNMGAEEYDRAKAIFRRALLIISIFSLIGLVVIISFRNPLLSLFIKDMTNTELVSEASEYLIFSAFIIFFMGYYSSLTGFFQGTGHTSYSMYMSAGRLWVLRLPIIWVFSRFTNLGSTGIWIAMLLSNMLTCLYGFVVYKTKEWKKISNI